MSDASMNTAPAATQRETWHDGEKAIQQRIGVADKMDAVGRRVVRDYMPEQHRQFYAQLPFIVAGSVDDAGNAWATLLTGTPGFVASPTPRILTLAVTPDETDPARAGMRQGDGIGLLGIELHTRRRNRVNGFVTKADDGVIEFAVDQSFGNCPRYIQLRDFAFARDPSTLFDGKTETLDELDAAARETLAAADTFFVASYAECDGRRQVADASCN